VAASWGAGVGEPAVAGRGGMAAAAVAAARPKRRAKNPRRDRRAVIGGILYPGENGDITFIRPSFVANTGPFRRKSFLRWQGVR